MKSRYFIALAAILFATAALPRLSRAQGPPLYSVININPVGYVGSPTGINDDDQICGNASNTRAFLWMPGVPSFDIEATFIPNYAFAINNLAQIAGGAAGSGNYWTVTWDPYSYFSASYSVHFFVEWTANPALLSAFNAINDDSYMAGYIGAGGGFGTPPGAGSAVESDPAGSEVTNSDYTLNGVSNISEDVCATVTTNANPAVSEAAWFPNYLTSFGGNGLIMQGGTFNTIAYGDPSGGLAIDDADTVVGYAQNGKTGQAEAFAWDGPSGTAFGPLGYLPRTAYSVANAINTETGEVVGQSGTHAFLWTGDVTLPQYGMMTDMNKLIAPHSGWLLRDATALNDYGDIVGTGYYHQAPTGFLAIPTVLTADPVDSPSFSQSASGSITGAVTFTYPAPFDLGLTISLYNESTGLYSASVGTRVLAGATTAEYRIPIPSSPTITVPEAYLVKATFGGARAYSAFKLTP